MRQVPLPDVISTLRSCEADTFASPPQSSPITASALRTEASSSPPAGVG